MLIDPDPVSALKRIEAWLAREYPDRLPLFRPGASAGTLQRVEAKLGATLPGDIRMLYAAHDGQPEGAPSLYLNQRWLPVDVMAVTWEDLCRRYGAAVTAEWSTGWLPLFGSVRGDHYCVDIRVRPSGRAGPIIWFLYDNPERAIIAHDITQMLERVADGVETGRWRLDDGYDGFSD
ncbi:SMI1/KNR4 family protein [Microvirga terrae]|uniref:SMI1/KNR4 family protein n=1 Tax=Microvirga terrae TaxID=2740529 RepID=A0ABY5RTX6_9HYPH|nr:MULTISPECIES: SMI1/KNR4 family protein [Microvirga]MBQ0822750.1 SMI1/KNR4 family protein [Microvirga sp. HBU67558]UVF20473.1 SMI1/KNR4 family protein [Microvirga terrae]